MYLTYAEYKDFELSSMTQEEFLNLVERASDFLDSRTRSFYRFNDLEIDIDFRKKKFKKAVALQVEYMFRAGASGTLDMQTPQTWSVDGMSVGAREAGKSQLSIISQDAMTVLSGTGLLYRGLR